MTEFHAFRGGGRPRRPATDCDAPRRSPQRTAPGLCRAQVAVAVMSLFVAAMLFADDDTPTPSDPWVAELERRSEPASSILYRLVQQSNGLRTEVIARAAHSLTADEMRGTWAKLRDDETVESDRWIIESYHALPPRHTARLHGASVVASFLDPNRSSPLIDHYLDELEKEEKANDKLYDKMVKARRRGKKIDRTEYRGSSLAQSQARTYLELLRSVSKTERLEREIWKESSRKGLPVRHRALLIQSLEGAVDLRLLKKVAKRYPADSSHLRIACLRVLAAAAREYRMLDSKSSRDLTGLLPKLLDQYLDVEAPPREETRALIHLVSQQRGGIGLKLVSDEAIHDTRIGERVHATHQLSRFTEHPRFTEVLERIERSSGRDEAQRRALTIAILEMLVDGNSELAATRLAQSASDAAARVRLAVAGLALSLPAEESVPIVTPLLDDPCPQVADVALWTLYKTRRYSALAPVVKRLQSIAEKEGILADDAFEILALATGESFDRDVDRWVGWWGEQSFEPEAQFPVQHRPAGTAVGFFGHRIYSYHVGFVLDLSGSMNAADGPQPTTRFEILAREFERALRSLDPDVRFNVVTFSSQAQRLWPEPKRATSNHVAEALEFLTKTRGGNTHYEAALDLALGIPALDTIYFLSDGEPNMTPGGPAAIRTRFARENVATRATGSSLIVNTVGIRGSSELLEQLAGDHLGQFRAMTLFVPLY
ncbi:MAG: vWA domain-containing protein [Planctomycetota bacterium]